MILGAHESIAGGLAKAFGRAIDDSAECLQIFTKNARGWKAKPLDLEDIELFRDKATATGLPVIAHCAYLVNLASGDSLVRQKSIAGFADELERCSVLGIPFLVLHPGSHPNLDIGIELIAAGIDEAFATAPSTAKVLLEVTAGQGISLGYQFEHLARIIELSQSSKHIGVCLDTCHLFAAGYDIATAHGYVQTMKSLDSSVGVNLVKAIHLNDSKQALGSHVDRHDEIGDGALGLNAFAHFLRDPRFKNTIGILETPNPELFRRNLDRLRSLRD